MALIIGGAAKVGRVEGRTTVSRQLDDKDVLVAARLDRAGADLRTREIGGGGVTCKIDIAAGIDRNIGGLIDPGATEEGGVIQNRVDNQFTSGIICAQLETDRSVVMNAIAAGNLFADTGIIILVGNRGLETDTVFTGEGDDQLALCVDGNGFGAFKVQLNV